MAWYLLRWQIYKVNIKTSGWMGAVPVSVSQYFNVSSMSSKLDGAYHSPAQSSTIRYSGLSAWLQRGEVMNARIFILPDFMHPKALRDWHWFTSITRRSWAVRWLCLCLHFSWDYTTFETQSPWDALYSIQDVKKAPPSDFNCPTPQGHGHQIHHLSWWCKLHPMHQEIQETLFFPVRSDHVVDPWDLVFNT